jgi:hypothetical protein
MFPVSRPSLIALFGLLLELVLIIEEEIDDLGDDLRFLLVLQVLEVLVYPTELEVCPKKVVVPDLP